MTKKIVLHVDREELHRFHELSRRLELDLEDMVIRLLTSAVDALEGETHVLWPFYLVQAGTEVITVTRNVAK